MKVVLVLALTVTASSYAGPIDEFYPTEWVDFKMEHGRYFNNPFEELFRLRVFMENKRKIDEHNGKYERGELTYQLKMNRWGDLMAHELKALVNGFRMPASSALSIACDVYMPANVTLPEAIDWRQQGAVTPVKNQGYCGSCWAFSATGSLEGQLFLKKKGALVSLSEQNLVDCSSAYGNNGCNGGLMHMAYQYIKDNNGIDTESSYTYRGKESYRCHFKPSSVGGTDNGSVCIPQDDEEALKNAVATVGPIAVAIDAGHNSFQFYYGGVYQNPDCSTTSLDHAVLVVGYGTEDGSDYWLVKNSWGTNWGDRGYIKMARNQGNNCGIATMAVYPIV